MRYGFFVGRLHMLLSLIVLLVVAEHGSARSLSAAVKRALARDLIGLIESVHLLPTVQVPVRGNLHPNFALAHHNLALMDELQEKFSSDADILHNYLNLYQDPTTAKGNELVAAVYLAMQDTADAYVKQSSSDNKYPDFFWHWGANVDHALNRVTDTDRVALLQQVISSIMHDRERIRARRDGDVDLLQIYQQLMTKLNGTELQEVEDAATMLTDLPQLSFKLPQEQAKQIQAYLDSEDISLTGFYATLDEVMTPILALDIDNPISLQSKITNIDILNREALARIVEKYNGKTPAASKIDLIHANPSLAPDLAGMSWQITWDDLRTNRFLASATGELLLKMGWSWRDFAELLYPDDPDAQARFISAFNMSNQAQQIALALLTQIQKATLSEADQLAAIDSYLAELPHLEEKRNLMAKLEIVQARDELNDDWTARPELEGSSRRQLLEQAFANHTTANKHWLYLTSGGLMTSEKWYLPSLELAQLLFEDGVTEKQLREHVFTPAVFTKLLANETITEQELATWRQSLSREKLMSLFTQLGIEEQSARLLVRGVVSLPAALQLEGFARATVAGLASNAKFITQLQKITATDSMYAPLARDILRELNEFNQQPAKRKRRQSKKKLKTSQVLSELRQALQAVDAKMFAARKNYLNASRNYLLYSVIADGDATLFKIGETNSTDHDKNIDPQVARDLVGMVAQAEPIKVIALPRRDGMSAQELLAVLLEFYGEHGRGELRVATAAELDGIAMAGQHEGWLKSLTGSLAGERLEQMIMPALEEATARINVHRHVPRTTAPRRDPLAAKQKKHRAPTQAQQERQLTRRIKKLATQIGREGLPSDTPVWLRLRAIINYAGTTPAELTGRAAMRNFDAARLMSIIAPESTVLPTYAEVQTLQAALAALHTPKRKKLRREDRYMRRSRYESWQKIEKEVHALLERVGRP